MISKYEWIRTISSCLLSDKSSSRHLLFGLHGPFVDYPKTNMRPMKTAWLHIASTQGRNRSPFRILTFPMFFGGCSTLLNIWEIPLNIQMPCQPSFRFKGATHCQNQWNGRIHICHWSCVQQKSTHIVNPLTPSSEGTHLFHRIYWQLNNIKVM